jgi:hypothetical protein
VRAGVFYFFPTGLTQEISAVANERLGEKKEDPSYAQRKNPTRNTRVA